MQKEIMMLINQKISFQKMVKNFGLKFSFMVERKELELMLLNGLKKQKNWALVKFFLQVLIKDGTKDGYDILLTSKVVDAVSIPVIASGGCGKPDDVVEIFKESNVDAALAASIFHYETHGVNGVKSYLKNKEIPVRL